MQKYSKEYLERNNLDDNFHEDQLKYIKSAIENCQQHSLWMIIESYEVLDAMLPELVKYRFEFGERAEPMGCFLKIHIK